MQQVAFLTGQSYSKRRMIMKACEERYRAVLCPITIILRTPDDHERRMITDLRE